MLREDQILLSLNVVPLLILLFTIILHKSWKLCNHTLTSSLNFGPNKNFQNKSFSLQSKLRSIRWKHPLPVLIELEIRSSNHYCWMKINHFSIVWHLVFLYLKKKRINIKISQWRNINIIYCVLKEWYCLINIISRHKTVFRRKVLSK